MEGGIENNKWVVGESKRIMDGEGKNSGWIPKDKNEKTGGK